MQGGSTITQQFVKNSCVTSQRTISRKLKEAALAWQLEQRWSKDRILTAYLNTIYFGNGAYGVQQRAQTYFHHERVETLTLPEAALLAGIPPIRPLRPGRRTRRRARERAGRRAADDARTRTTSPTPTSPRRPRAAAARRGRPAPGNQGPAPYFVNYVKQQLIEDYGTRTVFGGGLNVQTTIDLRLQKLARDAIERC